MFDLRSLEHSTIIYETPDLTPLMRLSWNKQDPNYLATILTDSAKTVIVDIRSFKSLLLYIVIVEIISVMLLSQRHIKSVIA